MIHKIDLFAEDGQFAVMNAIADSADGDTIELELHAPHEVHTAEKIAALARDMLAVFGKLKVEVEITII